VADLNLPVTRRSVLLGAAGLLGSAALLNACGSDDDPSNAADEFMVAPRFPNVNAFVPGEVRLPISLTRPDASLLTTGPERLTGSVRDDAGNTIGQIDAVRRGTGLSVPYWSIVTTLPAAGLYAISIDGALGDPSAIMVVDAAQITMPAKGTVLPGFDTPTLDDPRDVDPICTRTGSPCPFHTMTLNEALQLGKPIAYIIGTPAHCQFATCGPGLEFLMQAASTYADRVTFVHAEVYADPAGTEVAPAVEALTLQYEPVIFLTDADGVVTDRIDIVWDADELSQLLAAAFS
jgi:hypothetical protein